MMTVRTGRVQNLQRFRTLVFLHPLVRIPNGLKRAAELLRHVEILALAIFRLWKRDDRG